MWYKLLLAFPCCFDFLIWTRPIAEIYLYVDSFSFRPPDHKKNCSFGRRSCTYRCPQWFPRPNKIRLFGINQTLFSWMDQRNMHLNATGGLSWSSLPLAPFLTLKLCVTLGSWQGSIGRLDGPTNATIPLGATANCLVPLYGVHMYTMASLATLWGSR